MIVLGEGTVTDKTGNMHKVRCEIEGAGYIPDVYVRILVSHPGLNHDLCEDQAFVASVFEKILRPAGYVGRMFGRAEIGMQKDDCVVLEPNESFDKFAEYKGFVDLGKERRASKK